MNMKNMFVVLLFSQFFSSSYLIGQRGSVFPFLSEERPPYNKSYLLIGVEKECYANSYWYLLTKEIRWAGVDLLLREMAEDDETFIPVDVPGGDSFYSSDYICLNFLYFGIWYGSKLFVKHLLDRGAVVTIDHVEMALRRGFPEIKELLMEYLSIED